MLREELVGSQGLGVKVEYSLQHDDSVLWVAVLQQEFTGAEAIFDCGAGASDAIFQKFQFSGRFAEFFHPFEGRISSCCLPELSSTLGQCEPRFVGPRTQLDAFFQCLCGF